MDRKKIIYIGSILLVTVFVSVTYFSYAFFTSKNEYHGKVNMVVGTLDYKLSSKDLNNNNQITLSPNSIKKIKIKVTSLNEIDSKYELFYETTSDDVEVGYTGENASTGTISAKASKEVEVFLSNTTDSNITVTFSCEGGFTHNTLVKSKGISVPSQANICENYTTHVWNYDYTGDVQEFVSPCDGVYTLETWGAQGGSVQGRTNYNESYGGYSIGNISTGESAHLYITVGGRGTSVGDYNAISGNENGYNGGGQNSVQEVNKYYGSGGGGATHISDLLIKDGLLKYYLNNVSNLLIISGGGGGSATSKTSTSNPNTDGYGGSGGGISGADGITTWTGSDIRTPGTGGTQTSAGISSETVSTYMDAAFGIGCIPNTSYNSYMRVAGGGGLYGGGCGIHSGGGGGSGYVGNSNLYNKAMYCYDCEESSDVDTRTISTTGDSFIKDTTNCPNGYSSNPVSKCAKAGNGYARITYSRPADYQISSSKLIDHSIKVASGLTNRFDIKIKNLQDINTRYELYYETDNDDVDVNYTSTSLNNPTGTINANGEVTVSIRINNETNSDATVIFKVVGVPTTETLNTSNINHIEALCDNTTTFCISTTQQLINLATQVNAGDSKNGKTYYLENDLDLGGKFDSNGNLLAGSTNWTPIGDYNSGKAFSGIFDGDGHIIRNLYIYNQSNSIYSSSGLFGNTSNAKIRKLGIENSYIKGVYNQGAIIGWSTNSEVEQVYSFATVEGTARTAGICGSCSSVKDSYNGGTIINGRADLTAGIISGWGTATNTYNFGNITSQANSVGGIVGWSSNSVNSYNLGTVSGSDGRHVGGILGQGTSGNYIRNSYNNGSIIGGGILGREYDVGIIENMNISLSGNYYLIGSASYGIYLYQSDANAAPLTASEMPTVLSVINGDGVFMEDVYNINNGNPILKWQVQYR